MSDLFDIAENPDISRRDLRAACLAWLMSQEAMGLATQVPTRITNYRADIAAFWSEAGRNPEDMGPSRILHPTQTMVIECRRNRQECWPDCSNSSELSPELYKLKNYREQLQKQIQIDEPQLRATDTLFDEYTEWYYEKTENSDYHQVCRDIRKLEDALYKGSRFEAINSAKLADFCYLAVPENVVHPHELASNWGLIWVREDKTLEIITPALNQHCSQGSQLHLIQNIAIAASENVYFANGIIEKDGVIHFLRPPRRRRISKGKFK